MNVHVFVHRSQNALKSAGSSGVGEKGKARKKEGREREDGSNKRKRSALEEIREVHVTVLVQVLRSLERKKVLIIEVYVNADDVNFLQI